MKTLSQINYNKTEYDPKTKMVHNRTYSQELEELSEGQGKWRYFVDNGKWTIPEYCRLRDK